MICRMSAHQPLDLGEVRRQLRLAIEASKRDAAAHRHEVDAAGKSFDELLEHVAAPLFRQFTSALRGEGLLFRVITPAGGLRIESERSTDNFLELALDTTKSPVALLLRRGYTRGHHLHTDDRLVAEGADFSGVTPSQLLEALMDAVTPFIGR
jgi:hypothetical protein